MMAYFYYVTLKGFHSYCNLLKRISHKLLLGVCLTTAFTAYGQAEEDTLNISSLPTISITASRISGSPSSSPLSISIITQDLIQKAQQQLSINEALDFIPGVFALNPDNFAQDLRISIRGFGARAAFGIRGIKVLVDGIPESTPDGQAQVDNLDLGVLDRVEIIRGPSSGLYGNAAGGVINIQTERPPQDPFAEARLSWGSFGFQRYQLKAGVQKGPLGALIYVSHTQTDGFREQSGMENTLFNGKFNWEVDSTMDVQLLLNYVNSPVADDPGGIDASTVAEDREQARDQNVRFETGEAIEQGRIALSLTKKLGMKHDISARVYYLLRNFEGRLPFEFGGLVRLDRDYVGGGIAYTYLGTLAQKPYRLQLGLDIDHQNDDRRRFRNLEGERGEQTLAQDEIFRNIGVYAVQEWNVIDKLRMTLGTRVDIVRLEADDRFLGDGDQSGNLSFNRFSPTIGASYEWRGNQFLFSNVSTSFETPALSELSANPEGTGGFNENLEPQKALNTEIGIKGRIQNTIQYELALFRIQLRDELVPFELAAFPERTFFRNAGESRRNGVELNLQYAVTPQLLTQFSYTYSDFEYTDYEVDGESLEGNTIPGIPNHLTYVGVRYTHSSGFYGRIWNRWVSDLFANDGNTVEVDAFTVTNLRLGYEKRWDNYEVEPFLGVNNLFDEAYSGNIRINAFGGRFFEPAPGVHLYGGVRVRFQ